MGLTKLHPPPLYQQAADNILQRLQAQEWQEGDALPNEFELAAQCCVSQGTMRRALDGLVEKGVLLRRQGAGTFVAECQDFISQARAAHLGDPFVKETIRFEFVSIKRLNANALLADMLAVRKGANLWQITRLLRAGATVFGMDQAYLPEAIFPTLDIKRIRYWKANLRRMCLIDLGMHLVEGAVCYRAVLPHQEAMRVLQVKQSMPFLERMRTLYTMQKIPVVGGISTFRTDGFAFCPDTRDL